MTSTTSTTQPATIYASGLGMHISTAASAALEARLQNEVVNAISTIGFSYNFILTILDQTTGIKPEDASQNVITEMVFNVGWMADQMKAEPILNASADIASALDAGRAWVLQANAATEQTEALQMQAVLQQVEAICEGAEEGIYDAYTTLEMIAETVLKRKIDLSEMKKWAAVDQDVEDIHALQAECDVIFGVVDAPADLPDAELKSLQFGDLSEEDLAIWHAQCTDLEVVGPKWQIDHDLRWGAR